MKKGVMRPGHVQIRVLDLEEARKHYVDLLGLIEMDSDEQGRIYLKAWTEVDKYSVILKESDEPGMDFMASNAWMSRYWIVLPMKSVPLA
ncbi:hypothetical protein [Nitrincola sp. A-D6]|uniref:hypothetical protein n=1 Tax=Nitrincola sp. A-D6 TaxID=1545442 RepID=UPI000AC0EC46